MKADQKLQKSDQGKTAKTAFVAGRAAVVGLGLIGGSVALGLMKQHEVWGDDANDYVLEQALEAGLSGRLDKRSIQSCECIVLAAFPRGCQEWLEEHASLIAADALVLDVAGVKRSICPRAFTLAKHYGFNFVGAHPMAGSERGGFINAHENLFKGAPLVLCPDPELEQTEQKQLISRIEDFFAPLAFGSITTTSPERHDRLIAFTSQLAHIVSNAYIKSPTARAQFGYSAGSYRDLTRVARLNPDMWTELMIANADNLAEEISRLRAELWRYEVRLRSGDAVGLRQLLADGDRLKREEDKHDGN